MKHLIASSAALILSSNLALASGHANPGAHFIETWDLDGDGAITLAEATEKRSDIFYMFDTDENGILNDQEYSVFDDTREADMQENAGAMAKDRNNPANGMMRQFTDVNGNGQISRDEFITTTPAWFSRMDKTDDGLITGDDFGKGK